jgi:hypothetical protein
LLPIPGIPLASLVESHSGEADAALFVCGVTTARVLVWLLGERHHQIEFLRRLVLAALFQDVGRLSVDCGSQSVRAQCGNRGVWLERQHPSIGAGLLGSIRGAPVEFPMLVAQHHEQLDGGGFPRALANGDVLRDSAILAAAGRFADLCLVPHEADLPPEISPAGTSVSIVGKSALMLAAEALVAEAEWGKWPLEFCRFLARRVAESKAPERLPPLEDLVEIGDEICDAEIDLSEPVPVNGTGDERRLQWLDYENALQGAHLGSSRRHLRAAAGADKSRD